LSGLLLSRRIFLLLLSTRLLALICFVCHLKDSYVGLSSGSEMSILDAEDVRALSNCIECSMQDGSVLGRGPPRRRDCILSGDTRDKVQESGLDLIALVL
jgi:hypothetical protein